MLNTKQLAGDLKLYAPLMKELEGVTYYFVKKSHTAGTHHFITNITYNNK